MKHFLVPSNQCTDAFTYSRKHEFIEKCSSNVTRRCRFEKSKYTYSIP